MCGSHCEGAAVGFSHGQGYIMKIASHIHYLRQEQTQLVVIECTQAHEATDLHNEPDEAKH